MRTESKNICIYLTWLHFFNCIDLLLIYRINNNKLNVFFQIRLDRTTPSHVRLVPGVIKESHFIQPIQFLVGKLTMMAEYDSQKSEVIISIPLSRQYQYHLSATFCPTLFLLIIACLTLFINPAHFEATVALSLTTMLVMQTLQANISSELPKTPYMKIIDIWLTFGMAVPFAVFLVLVLVEALPLQGKRGGKSLENKTKKKKLGKKRWFTKERVHGFFKVLIPVCTAVFVGAFWVYVITLIHKIA